MKKPIPYALLLGLFLLPAVGHAQEKGAFVYEMGPIPMASAGGWVAAEKGFYGKVNVKEIRGERGISPIQRVMASAQTGDVAFGVDYPETILRAREREGLNLIALSVDFQNSAMRILSWTPIKSAKEIKGDFGIWEGNDAKAKCAVGKGWEKQCTFQNQGEGIGPWLSGKWPLASAMTYHELILVQREVKKMGNRFYTIDYKDLGIDWMDNVLFTTEEIVRKHPDVVQAVVSGRYKGFQWAFKNPRETFEILKKNHEDLDLAREMDAMDPIKVLMITPDSKRSGFGHILPKKWEKVAKDMFKAGLLEKMPDMKSIYTERFPSGITAR